MTTAFVHTLFEIHAQTTPDAIAVCESGQSVTYHTLNENANKLAALLRLREIKPEQIVSVVMPAGIPLITAMLGTFKAGGVYLPVDLNFSEKRLKQIFTETFDGIVLACIKDRDNIKALIARYQIPVNHLIWLHETGSILSVESAGADNPPPPLPAENPAIIQQPNDGNYIFYTSGSTGEGKAILGSHISLSHYTHWVISEFEIDHTFRIPHLSQPTFDASMKEYWMAFTTGATLYIPPQEVKQNMLKMAEWLSTEKISTIQGVPSVFRLLTSALKELREQQLSFNHLKYVFLYGEVLYNKDIQEWRSVMGSTIEVVNLYGTTETTILDTFHRIKDIGESPAGILHVGQPIHQTFILIINDNRLCRIGEMGEVYIKTPFMTKGYLKAELNSAAFVQNPLITGKTDIVYRTGDKGRYLKGRDVEILGRIDRQVKINGIRVELQEVEKAVLEVTGIQEAVVTVHITNNSQRELICYYTGTIDRNEIRNRLTGTLNKEIIPGYFIKLDRLPLNMNGKIDKKALPIPQDLTEDIQEDTPQGPVEIKLENAWKAVTGLKKTGRSVSFFSIGGNSLKAIQLVAEIYKAFGVSLSLRDIFEHKTIQAQAAFLANAVNTPQATIEPAAVKDYYPLSESQQLFFSENNYIEERITGKQLFTGTPDLHALQMTIGALIERHESLRTIFPRINGTVLQQVLPVSPSPFVLETITITDETLMEEYLQEEINRPFDLEKGPLISARLFHLPQNKSLLTYVLHHIIADGWSMEILERELFTLYAAFAGKEAAPLDKPVLHYKDYAQWQQKVLNSPEYEAHKKYWLHKFSDGIQPVTLPFDFPYTSATTNDARTYKIIINREEQQKMQAFAEQSGVTLFVLFLSSFNLLLSDLYGHNNTTVLVPVASREQESIKNIIGCFVNFLMLRSNVDTSLSYTDYQQRVSEDFLASLQHQSYPFIHLAKALNIPGIGPESTFMPAFINMHNFNNAGKSSSEDFGKGHTDKGIPMNLPLGCVIAELADGIGLRFVYNAALFKPETMEEIAQKYLQLLNTVTGAPHTAINNIHSSGTLALNA